MKRALLLVAALLLAGCTAPAPEPTPDEPLTITVDGLERTYLLTPPARENASLVLMLHAGQETGAQARRDYNWEALAAEQGFAVVYPDGIGGSWNAGGCCAPAMTDGVDDVAFLTALVETVSTEYATDPRKIYVAGMSNGALMAYRLACETDLFAAIAAVGGTMVSECPDPAPTSVFIIHGEADGIVTMAGVIGPGQEDLAGMPIAEIDAFWRGVDDCEPPQVGSIDGVITTSTAQCAEFREVRMITIAGAGHQWPGSLVLRSGVDAPFDSLDATGEIWSFLVLHPHS